MKRLINTGLIAGLLLWGVLLWPAGLMAADYAARTGFSYQSWTSDEDESGSQFYIPIQIQSDADKLSWHFTTGYANTLGDIEGADEASVSGLLDTQVGATYLFSGAGGLDWLVGLDVNLPTGQTGLEEDEVRIMVDPDLVSIITPGQGLNINPTVSVAHQGERFGVGLGLGYAFQGEYDFTEETEEYDPGDIFKVAAEADYAFTEAWLWSLQAQFLTMTADTIEGDDYLQKGDAWLVGTGLKRSVEGWELEMTLCAIFRSKAAVSNSNNDLVTESRVSQGNEYLLDIASRHQLRPATRLDIGLEYLYMAENDYEESSSYYMGSRVKYSLSVGVQQQLNETLELQGALAGFTMDDEPSWLHPGQDRQYQGWSITAAVVQHF